MTKMLQFIVNASGSEVMHRLSNDPEEMASALLALDPQSIAELGEDVSEYLSDEQATETAGTLRALANAIDPVK